LVQITWANAFCQSVKLAHNSSSTGCYTNVPEMYQKKVNTLRVIIATIPFKVVLLGGFTMIQIL